MADPQAALLTQVKNIQAKTGLTLAQMHEQIEASGKEKYAEKRSWVMERFGLGHGDANTVVHFIGKPLPTMPGGKVSTNSLSYQMPFSVTQWGM